MEIGTIVSTSLSPTPTRIDFVITSGIVRKGQFVEIPYNDGLLIALVNDVLKTNHYFERPEAVKEFEHNISSLETHFPVSEWEFLIGSAQPLAVLKDNSLLRPSFPPSPGSRVFVAKKETIQRFLSLDPDGLNLGTIQFHDIPLKANLDRLLKKHLAILALSGAGKSYLVSVLLEELLERTKNQGRIATIVIDPHGEYRNFAEPLSKEALKQGRKDYSSKTRLVEAKDIRIASSHLTEAFVSNLNPSFSSVQKREFRKIIDLLRKNSKKQGPFDLEDLQFEIEQKEMDSKTKSALYNILHDLRLLKLFSKTDNPSFYSLAKPGTLTIIDLSSLIDMRKKQAIVYSIAKMLFEARRNKDIPPFLLVIEEAHQFIPEYSQDRAISRSIIETIAREGRKFGASLCLVSQRPIKLDPTVLAQCNTQIILRITNPNDLDHVSKSAEGIDSKSKEMITSLRVGEALIVGEAFHYPVFCKIRERKSQDPLHEKTLAEMSQEFDTDKEKLSKDADFFLDN